MITEMIEIKVTDQLSKLPNMPQTVLEDAKYATAWTIRGKAFWVDKEQRKYPTVIYSHGFNSCYDDIEQHGEYFVKAGFNCIFYDFCGGGERTKSDGSLTEMTIFTEINDLLNVVSYASSLDWVNQKQLYLQGESQGGFVSAYVASLVPETIKAMVLWFPAFVIPRDSKLRFEKQDNTVFGLQINEKFSLETKDMDIYSQISKYTGPVKIIHGDQDEIVPIQFSERAIEVYQNASFSIINGAGHGYGGQDCINAREESIAFFGQ